MDGTAQLPLSAQADFEALRKQFRARGFYEKKPVRVTLEFVASYAMVVGSVAVFVAFEALWIRALALLVSTYGMVAVATNCHTASHRGISDNRWLDDTIASIGFATTFGMSTTYWYHSHVQMHHPNPNVISVDYDTDLAPWFWLHRDTKKAESRWLRAYYRIQWLLFVPALAVNVFSVQLQGLRYLAQTLLQRRKRRLRHWIDLAVTLSHWGLWLGLPMLFFPAQDVIALYLLRFVLMGYGLFIVVAPHHFPREAAYLGPDAAASIDDYFLRQTATTLDFRAGRLGYLFCSGADHQIEHHLFPSISHVHFPSMRADVEAFCRRHGYPYRRLGWGEALRKAFGTVVRPKPVCDGIEALRAHARSSGA